jgi:hypothetical protein
VCVNTSGATTAAVPQRMMQLAHLATIGPLSSRASDGVCIAVAPLATASIQAASGTAGSYSLLHPGAQRAGAALAPGEAAAPALLGAITAGGS